MFECYQFVQCTRGPDPVILCGDFNTKPSHTPYHLFTKCLGLKDAFLDLPLDTCDLTTNIYTVKTMTPKRIDYIFYADDNCPSHHLVLEGKALALSGPVPGMGYPYSDHEGLEATFTLKRREEPHCPVPILMTGMLLEGGRVKCVCDHTYLWIGRRLKCVCLWEGKRLR